MIWLVFFLHQTIFEDTAPLTQIFGHYIIHMHGHAENYSLEPSICLCVRPSFPYLPSNPSITFQPTHYPGGAERPNSHQYGTWSFHGYLMLPNRFPWIQHVTKQTRAIEVVPTTLGHSFCFYNCGFRISQVQQQLHMSFLLLCQNRKGCLKKPGLVLFPKSASKLTQSPTSTSNHD